MGAVEILSALCDPARLAMLGRIAETGAAGCDLDAAAGPGASPRDARRQVARLTAAGLVEGRRPAARRARRPHPRPRRRRRDVLAHGRRRAGRRPPARVALAAGAGRR
jgi:hypothetical protein